ncbi:MAG: hypothetical protein QNJ36_05135 [Calothrix sp. MO_167.B42]|nr:hypothetical protein [Calothrix sp. MO_167.B42]
MQLTSTDAGNIALDFILAEWNIPENDKDWFVIISSRLLGESWYIVELGIAGFADRWFIQVYDTGECDPNYTFTSPVPGGEGYIDLESLPHLIGEVIISERSAR